MKKTLKLLALMLVLVMALGMLAACGDSNANTQSPDPVVSDSQPVDESPAVPDEPSDEPDADTVDRAEYGIPEEYTKVKIITGTYGFGDAELAVAMTDDESAFYITFTAFDEEQILEGTIANGICIVSYDATGFMSGDCQLMVDDALASSESWAPLQ